MADIHRARAVHHADIVIPFMHWGEEHSPLTNDRQRQLARLMIDAGAGAVVGTHPHVVQDIEHHKGKPIVYSWATSSSMASATKTTTPAGC